MDTAQKDLLAAIKKARADKLRALKKQRKAEAKEFQP